jgi:hypothetical protein
MNPRGGSEGLILDDVFVELAGLCATPPIAVASCHVAVAAARARESHGPRRVLPQAPRRGRLRVPVAVATLFAGTLTTGSLAAAGELPDSVQRPIARAADVVGLEFPTAGEKRPADERPAESDPSTPTSNDRPPDVPGSRSSPTPAATGVGNVPVDPAPPSGTEPTTRAVPGPVSGTQGAGPGLPPGRASAPPEGTTPAPPANSPAGPPSGTGPPSHVNPPRGGPPR